MKALWCRLLCMILIQNILITRHSGLVHYQSKTPNQITFTWFPPHCIGQSSKGQGEGSRCGNNLRPRLTLRPNLSFIVSQRLKRSRGTRQLRHYSWVAELQFQLLRHRREEWATREGQFPQESNPPHREIMFCLHQRRVSVKLDSTVGSRRCKGLIRQFDSGYFF